MRTVTIMNVAELKAELAKGTAAKAKLKPKKKQSTGPERPVDHRRGSRGNKYEAFEDVGREDAGAEAILDPPALSILQPYASLVAAGARKLEVVEHYTGYRGLVFIHASPFSTGVDELLEANPLLADALDVRRIARLETSSIVGAAHLYSVQRVVHGYWNPERNGDPPPPSHLILNPRELDEEPLEAIGADLRPGRFALHFRNPMLFAEPLRFDFARPGLFDLPDFVLAQLRPLFE